MLSWEACENVIEAKKFSFLINLGPTANLKINRPEAFIKRKPIVLFVVILFTSKDLNYIEVIF